MNRFATYLYGFARSGTPVPEDLAGIEEGMPVRVLELACLTAVVSEVPVEPFESDAMTDLAWLVPRAVRHERLLESVRAGGPVFPVRFGALFSTREALESWASANRESIDGFLRHVADKDEWTITINLEVGSALDSLAAADPVWAARARTGVFSRYAIFSGKTVARGRARHARKRGRDAADRVRGAVHTLAEERLLAPRRPAVADLEPVLHAAYLVPRPAVSEFHERARRAAGNLECTRLECSGPWPPSHFCPPLAVADQLKS